MAKTRKRVKAAAKAAKAKAKRPKQTKLPEMEDGAIPEIEAAADDYIETRDARMALTEEEVSKQATLRLAMLRHGKQVYRRALDEETILQVTIVPGQDKVKASRKKVKKAA